MQSDLNYPFLGAARRWSCWGSKKNCHYIETLKERLGISNVPPGHFCNVFRLRQSSKQPFRTNYKGNEFSKESLIATRNCHCSQENERLLCRSLSARVDWPVTTSDPGKTGPIMPRSTAVALCWFRSLACACASTSCDSFIHETRASYSLHART